MTQIEKKGLSGFDKVLIGCGIGCAALILIVVLGIAFGTMWVFTPGKQAATAAIAEDSSLGVIQLHELAQDPGTQELLTRVLERIDEANREQQCEQLPPAMRWISDFQAQQADPAGLNMLIPREMTIVYEQAEDGEAVDYVIAFNPRTMVRMFKTMFSLISRGDESEELSSDYRGHSVYRFEEDANLAFVDSTVLFASSQAALERAIDRIDASEEGANGSTSFDFARSIPEGDWDVEGTLGNENGLIAGLLEDFTEPGPEPEGGESEGYRDDGDLHLGFGLDVVSADEIAGRAVLECGDRRAAERWLAVLEERYETMTRKAADRGLELEIEAQVRGERVVTELRLQGVEEMLVEALTFEEEPEEIEETEEES